MCGAYLGGKNSGSLFFLSRACRKTADRAEGDGGTAFLARFLPPKWGRHSFGGPRFLPSFFLVDFSVFPAARVNNNK